MTRRVERVAGGCVFAEGPAVDRDGSLYFSDCPTDRVLVRRADGSVGVHLPASGRANGLAFDHDGRLVACCDGKDFGARAVVRYEPDGTTTTLADTYGGRRLNSPNDLCFDHAGRLWFSDPRYGSADDLEQDRMAVYRLETDGTLVRVIEDADVPNGIALSADERTLYLVDHDLRPGGTRLVLAYEIGADGSCRRAGTLHDFGDDYGGDGLAVAEDGAVYATGGQGATAGVYVLAPDGGVRERIPTPELPGNLAFGGADGTDLFVCASTSVYRTRLDVRGLPLPPRAAG